MIKSALILSPSPKGLVQDISQLAPCYAAKDIYEAIAAGSGFFQHGHTYLAHPVACAAAHAVLSKIIASGLPSRATIMGNKLLQSLQSTFGQHPFIGDIRGRGLFIGMEFVADRTQKTPFDPTFGLHRKIKGCGI
jgi:adenosylmethionine-8-amino-7-oxononanoate aminotransferase